MLLTAACEYEVMVTRNHVRARDVPLTNCGAAITSI